MRCSFSNFVTALSFDMHARAKTLSEELMVQEHDCGSAYQVDTRNIAIDDADSADDVNKYLQTAESPENI